MSNIFNRMLSCLSCVDNIFIVCSILEAIRKHIGNNHFSYKMWYLKDIIISKHHYDCFHVCISPQVVPQHISICLEYFFISFTTWFYAAPHISRLYLPLNATRQFGVRLNTETACCLVIHGVESLFTWPLLLYYPSYSTFQRYTVVNYSRVSNKRVSLNKTNLRRTT